MTAEILAFGAGAAAVASAGVFASGVRRRRPREHPASAGARNPLALRAAAGVAGVLSGLLAGAVLPGRLGLLAAVVAPAAFLVPDLWLARRRRERIERMRHDVPVLLDLLRVSVEAGASLPEALAQVAARSRAPLARLWGGTAAAVAVGVPLADALERLRRDAPLAEVDALAAALARAARHGAPLSDTLAAQARNARLMRRRAVQERAAKAGPKMQLVVALLLVPSVMLLVAAALVSALSGGAADALFGGF